MNELATIAQIAAAAFVIGLILYAWLSDRAHKRRAKDLHARFNPKPHVPTRRTYVDHEPTVSAMRQGGAL